MFEKSLIGRKYKNGIDIREGHTLKIKEFKSLYVVRYVARYCSFRLVPKDMTTYEWSFGEFTRKDFEVKQNGN